MQLDHDQPDDDDDAEHTEDDDDGDDADHTVDDDEARQDLINLHVARAKVRKIDTVWIITVKLMWNNMKIPQAKDIWQRYCDNFGLNTTNHLSDRFCLVYVLWLQTPHVDDERDVFDHNKAVGDSNASEDHVDGVPHVLVGEHQDVGQVEQGAHHAH